MYKKWGQTDGSSVQTESGAQVVLNQILLRNGCIIHTNGLNRVVQPVAKRLETLYLIWTSRVPIRSSRFRPPLSLLKVGHNRRSCWNFRRTTLKIGEGEGSCLILEMWDFMRCLGRKSVFRVKCLNIFATGCLSTVTMCRDPVLLWIGLVVNVVMSI